TKSILENVILSTCNRTEVYAIVDQIHTGRYYIRTADVALREQVAFRDDALRLAHEDLFETKSILENVILSTCNRTEVYAIVDQIHTGRYYI
ncbi:hypothetical protein EF901_17440, partial [Staphylococcus aureus]